MEKAINIILLVSSNSPDEYFIEIENDQRQSIQIGTSTQTDNAYRRIRITQADLEKMGVE